MAEFVYTTVPGKIKILLAKIRQVGVPSKATAQWLKSVGFSSSNDYSLIGVLKFVGLIDSNSVPSALWSSYRGANYKSVLGDAVRRGYSDLFSVYSDADRRSQTDLDHVFSTSSNGGKQVIAKTISTFKALVEEAEFSSLSEDANLSAPTSSGLLLAPVAQKQVNQSSIGVLPGLHIDVQVHISPEASTEQIDQIFASMAKHLYGAKKSDE
ncbi:MAG: DUF5343 domain-containing protein [Terracidiphilus sp.]